MATAQKFIYKARKINGELIQGEVFANDASTAGREVSQLGLIPVSVKSGDSIGQMSGGIGAFATQFFKRVNLKEVMMFTHQLQTVYAVGLPIVQGLQMIQSQTENKNFKAAIGEILNQVKDGRSLSSAMAKFPNIFSDVYVNLVKVGEASGRLDDVLERLYSVLESEVENKAKVKSAMFYPKIVMGMILTTFVVLVNFIIPKMKAFYASLGSADLPLPTRIVHAISDFVNAYIWFFIVAGAILYYAFHRWVNTEKGRRTWDNLKLKLPVFGTLIVDIEMNSFCVVLQLLFKSGVGVVQSLEILKGTLSNQVVKDDVEYCRKKVISGGKIGEALNESHVFPKMLVGLVTVGEETGSLDKVLEKSSRHYKMQMDYKLNNLSKAIEPIMLAITFGMVLLLALAVFLPIWNMAAALKK